ncbi:peptidoglycan DL-endopeptidase CwlO [Virgibacillus siamensis]|uniref:Peptidoglycan DL-endopeptidase CwlO n=1 Tax=Virgibacillus siamensis TaxID=480071 RepID=A0ABN1FEP9_9BACI
MKKTISTIATAGVVVLGSAIFGTTVHAETPSNLQEVQSERSDIKQDLSKAESKIADVMVDLEKLNKKIEQVEHALEQNKQKMKETKGKISNTKKEVAAFEKEIKQLEEDIEKRYEILKDRIKSYQRSGGDVSFLQVVFGSESFSDLISRVSAVSKIAEADENLMKRQKEDKAELEKKQDKVEKKLSKLKDMKAELEFTQETILSQKDQVEADKKKLKNKEKDLRDMKAELENKDDSLAAVEQEIRDRQQREAQARSNNTGASSAGTDAGASSNSSSDGGDLTQLSSKSSKAATVSSGSYSSAIAAGYTVTGTPYVFGGKTPSGFDCSGFVSWAFAQAGVSIPSSTSALQSVGTRVSYSNAQPGDLIFFNTYKTNGHVGIYLGNGKFLGAQSSTGVAVASVNNVYWSKHFSGHVRRIK